MHACFEAIRKTTDVLTVNGGSSDDVSALCISALNPGSGIPLDEKSKPIHAAIIWNDSRAVKETRDVAEKIGLDRLGRITGNTSDPYFGFTKMLWIKNNLPKIWERTKKFSTPNGYAAYLLTGNLLYDLSYAGNLGGIFDIKKLDWSDELLNELGIPRSKLPDLVPCDQIVGEITSHGADLSGLRKGTPVAAGGDDAPTSALGSGALNDGEHNFMCGTSGCWNLIQDNRTQPWKVTTKLINYPFVIESRHKLESFGGSKTTGHCFKWFANLTGVKESKLDEEAENSSAVEKGISFVPQMMGERTPEWDSARFGSFHGLAGTPTRGEMFRAILESVAFDLLRHNGPIGEAGINLSKTMVISGPTAKSRIYRKILADITGYQVVFAARSAEAPGGDALIAALASKQVSDANVIKKWLRLDEVEATVPDEDAHKRYQEYFTRLWLPAYRSAQSIDDITDSWNATSLS
jgi:xylulokinase